MKLLREIAIQMGDRLDEESKEALIRLGLVARYFEVDHHEDLDDLHCYEYYEAWDFELRPGPMQVEQKDFFPDTPTHPAEDRAKREKAKKRRELNRRSRSRRIARRRNRRKS